MGQIEEWLGQLRDEVRKFEELGLVLKNIGCFDPRPSALPSATVKTGSGAATSPEIAGAGGDDNGSDPKPTSSDDVTWALQDESALSKGGEHEQSEAPTDDGNDNGVDTREQYDFRAVENQTQGAVESLRFHLTVLQRSVDQAHINMRIASQEFYFLLKKVKKVD